VRATNRETDPTVLIIVTTVIVVYPWVMGMLLEMSATWVTAGGGALLRYAGYL
jgi:hypothetical protein